LGSERCYFPDILKIGKEKGTSHQKRKKKEKKATDQKQNEPKYILVEDQLSPFFFNNIHTPIGSDSLHIYTHYCRKYFN
jgi:hypothetical protein